MRMNERRIEHVLAFEALDSRGTPTVATTGSAVDEVVRGAGVLFPPGDVDRCAHELARVLDDEALRAQLDCDGRARAATLTWHRSAEAHARAYARAVPRATS